jgi:hypothetical protein
MNGLNGSGQLRRPTATLSELAAALAAIRAYQQEYRPHLLNLREQPPHWRLSARNSYDDTYATAQPRPRPSVRSPQPGAPRPGE